MGTYGLCDPADTRRFLQLHSRTHFHIYQCQHSAVVDTLFCDGMRAHTRTQSSTHSMQAAVGLRCFTCFVMQISGAHFDGGRTLPHVIDCALGDAPASDGAYWFCRCANVDAFVAVWVAMTVCHTFTELEHMDSSIMLYSECRVVLSFTTYSDLPPHVDCLLPFRWLNQRCTCPMSPTINTSSHNETINIIWHHTQLSMTHERCTLRCHTASVVSA